MRTETASNWQGKITTRQPARAVVYQSTSLMMAHGLPAEALQRTSLLVERNTLASQCQAALAPLQICFRGCRPGSPRPHWLSPWPPNKWAGWPRSRKRGVNGELTWRFLRALRARCRWDQRYGGSHRRSPPRPRSARGGRRPGVLRGPASGHPDRVPGPLGGQSARSSNRSDRPARHPG